MAMKKRTSPNKTENTLTAAVQAELPAPATQETTEQAAELLASLAATTVAAVLEDREGFRQACRIIESRLHPDGADRDAWEAFQNAAVLLERHHVAQERRRRLAANTLVR
jgi:hypothetical protein